MSALKSLRCRQRLNIQGLVQGVGFRPFVYRIATELHLSGGVKNTSQGVVVEIEGKGEAIAQFLQRLQQELPPHASIQALQQQKIPTEGQKTFEIWLSTDNREIDHCTSLTARILPDLATCPNCLRDIFDTDNRRYHYPFTNCTHCGPRYTIVTTLPYDRQNTTMQSFSMCPDCRKEYIDPAQRRFHAQPNACPQCGPSLLFWSSSTEQHSTEQHGSPLQNAVVAIQQGQIIALKGLGGFQLLVDAQNSAAVERLRQRKSRLDKPFALMYPSLEEVRRHCVVSDEAAELLTSAQAPIVLLPRRVGKLSQEINAPLKDLAKGVSPNNPYLGIMLPTTPLHHLLMKQMDFPIVATSGNLSGEPICTDEKTARARLNVVADVFLTNNRPIQRPVDDSVVKFVAGQPQILRCARGYAPQRIQVSHQTASSPCVLALGGHLKSAIALSIGNEIVLSQHIGDLETPQSRAQLQQTVDDWLGLHRGQPTVIACDRHPDYASTQLAHTLAQQWHLPMITIQHHYAHILSCMAEHQLQAPALGIAWDGSGYGDDNTIWGGEFLHVTDHSFERVAHFLPYYLPSGEACILEPRRAALGLLYSCYGEAAFEMTDLPPMKSFTKSQLIVFRKMLISKINTPVTSSVGRLFDSIASLVGLEHYASFEGQAAIALEFAATQSPVKSTYPFTLIEAQNIQTQPIVIDWRPMVRAIIEDRRSAVMAPVIAARFHNTLVEIIVSVAKRMGLSQVVMAGGCFQNSALIERTIRRLSGEGFAPYWPQRIPPNDGGLAAGQVLAAWRYLDRVNRTLDSATVSTDTRHTSSRRE